MSFTDSSGDEFLPDNEEKASYSSKDDIETSKQNCSGSSGDEYVPDNNENASDISDDEDKIAKQKASYSSKDDIETSKQNASDISDDEDKITKQNNSPMSNQKNTFVMSINTEKLVRFCIFCKEVIDGSHFKRHLMRRHKHLQEIKELLKKSKPEIAETIAQYKRNGAKMYNLNLLHNNKTEGFMLQRKVKHLTMCSVCKEIVPANNANLHKKVCFRSTLFKIDLNKPNTFLNNDKYCSIFIGYINNIKSTIVREVIINDPLILEVGYKRYNQMKIVNDDAKLISNRRIILGDMREMCRIITKFKILFPKSEVKTFKDLFQLKLLDKFLFTLANMKNPTTNIVQNMHDILMRRTINHQIVNLMNESKDEEANDIIKFLDEYNLKIGSILVKQKKKEISLPSIVTTKDVKTLFNFIYSQFNIEDISFMYLSSLLITILSIYNGLTHSEVARLTLEQLGNIIIVDKRYSIINISGFKSSKISMLIHNQKVLPYLKKLITMREKNKINESNLFVFAFKLGLSHQSGSSYIGDVCEKAGIEKITIYGNCKRISRLLDKSLRN